MIIMSCVINHIIKEDQLLFINLHSYREQVLNYQIEARHNELDINYFLFPGNSNDNIIKFDVINNESLKCEIGADIFKRDNSMTLKFHTYNALVNLTMTGIQLGSKHCNVSLTDVNQSITHVHIDGYEDYILYKKVGEDIDVSKIRYTSCKKILFQMILDIQYIINKSFYQFRK